MKLIVCFFLFLGQLSFAQQNIREDILKCDIQVSENPGLIWRYIKNKTRTHRIPVEVEFNQTRATDVNSCCQLFSDFFKTTFLPAPDKSLKSPKVPVFIDECLNILPILHPYHVLGKRRGRYEEEKKKPPTLWEGFTCACFCGVFHCSWLILS